MNKEELQQLSADELINKVLLLQTELYASREDYAASYKAYSRLKAKHETYVEAIVNITELVK